MRLFYLRFARGMVLLSVLSMLVLAGAVSAQEVAECVVDYDAEVNYFPEALSVDFAESFTIEYHNNYKVITVLTPWQYAEETFTYVLVQCGTPAPEGYEDAAVIEVPVQTVVSMSTTYIPNLTELGLTDALVAVDEFDYIYNEDVRAAIDAGDVIEVGGGSMVNVEQVLDLDPDLIMTYGSGFADYDAHPVLLEAGLAVALNGDYTETTPLGRAEWVKFTAAFFNAEEEANALFDGIVEDYEALSTLAADATERPTVLVNAMYGDVWYISGGGSFAARLIEDAGGDFLWAEDESIGSLSLSFEDVFDTAQAADVWLNANFWFSLEEGLAEDARYGEFAAFQNAQIFNNNLRVTEFGGNDYSESAVLRPDLVLADLISIFHPELLPEHELVYFRHLE